MSEKKNKEKRKENLLTYDATVETPEEIIAKDKDEKRKEAFRETYKRIAKIIPEYFIAQRKRNKNSTSGGNSFTQNIVVTPDKATVQTKEVGGDEKVKETKQIQEEKVKERE